jgi:hypothetical protein
LPSFETVNNGDKRLYFVAMVGLGGFCVFYEVKIVHASSNRDVTDDVTIELTTSNNNKAKNSRVILVAK